MNGSDYTLAGNFNEEGTHGEISPFGGDTPAKGTYHDIELSLARRVSRHRKRDANDHAPDVHRGIIVA